MVSMVYATKVGWLKVSYTNYAGEIKEFVLENVQFIPGFWVNLFSLTAAMSKGCSIHNEDWMIVISKNSLELKFNEEIKTKNGFVCSITLVAKPATDCMLAMVATANHHRAININDLHKKLGHTSKALMRKTAKFYGWQLKNLFETCESCALAKLRQKDTNKEKKAQSETPGEWLFINISHVKNQSFGGSQFWLLAVNDATDFSFSLFLKMKDQTSQAMISLIRDLCDSENIVVKKI